jgi:predicted molibdopterin-dependent oxidoreductase YjgC
MNQGKLCIGRWNDHKLVHSPERLTTPLIRKERRLEETSWEDAHYFRVSLPGAIKYEHGRDSMKSFAWG